MGVCLCRARTGIIESLDHSTNLSLVAHSALSLGRAYRARTLTSLGDSTAPHYAIKLHGKVTLSEMFHSRETHFGLRDEGTGCMTSKLRNYHTKWSRVPLSKSWR